MRRTRVTAVLAVAAIAATCGALADVTPVAAASAAGSKPTALATAAPADVSGAIAGVAFNRFDPATWSNGRLAAQLTFVCIDSAATTTQRSLAAEGVGGITLLGRDAPSDLAARLAGVRSLGPHGVAPLIASDEEGGLVQRLANVIYPLPSAEVMGTWTTTHIRNVAYRYAQRMRALGLQADLAPVADLGIPGYYIDELHRAFSRWPTHVARDVDAWIAGMRSAGELTVVKHWPGHGQATNTHTGSATIPPLATLEQRDMIPFNAAFRFGVPVVMVGHLMSKGLTDPGWPATESPSALRYLRARVGWRTLVMTDSLSMAAATTVVGLTPQRAAVRALRSGADVALTCSPSGVVSAITNALDSGLLSRAKLVGSARRLLRLKARVGLVSGWSGPLPTTTKVHVAAATVSAGQADTLSATVRGGYRTVIVQELVSGSWHKLRSAVTGQFGWTRVRIPTGTVGTHRFRVYVPAVFPYRATTSTTATVTVTS